MQPLLSVDHESRNSHWSEPEVEQTESTPLVRRTPYHQHEITQNNDRVTAVIVALLLIILISGIVIGIYLLVLQSNSENILPPVAASLRFVSRPQWDTGFLPSNLNLTTNKAKQVVVVQTDTELCHDTGPCMNLLRRMKLQQLTSGEQDLPYNFVVSSQGETYEVLGWRRKSSLNTTASLILGFIGNFTETPPTLAQLAEAKSFMVEAVSSRHLEPLFTIVGRNTSYTPTSLFKSLQTLPQWVNEISTF